MIEDREFVIAYHNSISNHSLKILPWEWETLEPFLPNSLDPTEKTLAENSVKKEYSPRKKFAAAKRAMGDAHCDDQESSRDLQKRLKLSKQKFYDAIPAMREGREVGHNGRPSYLLPPEKSSFGAGWKREWEVGIPPCTPRCKDMYPKSSGPSGPPCWRNADLCLMTPLPITSKRVALRWFRARMRMRPMNYFLLMRRAASSRRYMT